jgi:hypothetical protein
MQAEIDKELAKISNYEEKPLTESDDSYKQIIDLQVQNDAL